MFAESRFECFKAAFGTLEDSEPSKLLADLKKLEQNLQFIFEHAHFESVSTWMKDLSSYLNNLRNVSQQTKFQLSHVTQIVESDHQTRILQWISPILYENYHKNQAKTNMQGTGD